MMKKYISLLLVLTTFLSISLFSQDLYWDSPKTLSKSEGYFPVVGGENETSFVIWQEVNSNRHEIWLSGQFYDSIEEEWIERNKFAGPFPYSGEVPNIFSVATTDSGIASIAVLSSANTISVFTTNNRGKSFSKATISNNSTDMVAPRIYKDSRNGFILFTTKGVSQSFFLEIARSTDGISWSNFEPFLPSSELTNSFVPTLIVLPNGNELAVWQSTVTENNRITYQLFSSINESKSSEEWSPALKVTSTTATKTESGNFSNQRPYLHNFKGKTYLAWERSAVPSQNPSIYLAEISPLGTISGAIEQTTLDNVIARQPVLFTYNDQLTILWFDTRLGTESIYFAQKSGILWIETRISTQNISSTFGFPLATNNNKDLHIFWVEQDSDEDSEVIRLSVDRNAPIPKLNPKSFVEGKRSSSDKIEVTIDVGNDSSGITGYSWILTKSAFLNPPEKFMKFPDEKITTYAKEDGRWYIKARTLDNAGNWSMPAILSYYRDTTPPKAPLIHPFTDLNNNFQKSNTFNVTWENTDKTDIVDGYAYSLEYITSLSNYNSHPENYSEEVLMQRTTTVPSRLVTSKDIASWYNYGNGVYMFSVAAVDSVGNIGEISKVPVYLNSYLPSTRITTVYPEVDIFGNVTLSIYGRDFTYEGTISEIYIDKDGIAPYDLVLEKKNNDYTVKSRSQITDITLTNLEEGTYRIGLLHSDRGLYMSKPILPIDEFGTVKVGDYSFTFKPDLKTISDVFDFTIQISDIVLWTVFILAIFGFLFAIRGLMITAKNTVAVQKEVIALITGGDMPAVAKQKLKALKKRGMSLKYKMMLFISVLVLTVIILVAIPFGYVFIDTQRDTLSDGLQERINVLSDSLAAGVKNFMPTANFLEMGLLLNQTEAMDEILHATILGLSPDGSSTNLDHVWVSNDPNIVDKIDTETLEFGKSRYTDERILPILETMGEINEKAISDVGEITENIGTLTQEGISLALATDDDSIARRNEIQNIINQLTENLSLQLNALGVAGSGSTPEFVTESLSESSKEYLFYKPVLFRQGSEQTYTRGLVLMEISVDNLLQSLNNSQMTIYTTSGIIAIFAIGIGIIGAFMLASIIIRPIRQLSAHVQMIRDTEDKEELEGKDIIIKARDEIGQLGDVVNDMTHGLVKAAAAAKDLTVGKEVQKMFIPLSVDETGKKLTTGTIEDNNAAFFGYYEGAKGVSGDYFDYVKLDERHFAIIKCDVSGKGVPASLIMVEVATLFLNYFRDWTYKKDKYNLSGIVGHINDLIESRGFKGRFAAFTLCIFDSVGGDVHFCNAGDNLVHIYDASENKKKTIVLTETPASGVFPTFMVDMRGGFVVEKLHLDKDDVLFLYTDGIEEAKRLFRDKDYNLINCEEDGLGEGDVHGFHTFGMDGEELAPDRVNTIIEAVFAKSTYKMEKFHSPVENEELIFDFSSCEGTAEEAIMALVSAEKIFRMYPTPQATEFDRVQVDRKVDEFLQKHFMQYNEYCSNKKDHPQVHEYMYYTHIKEDEQYDDLTLVAIKKK